MFLLLLAGRLALSAPAEDEIKALPGWDKALPSKHYSVSVKTQLLQFFFRSQHLFLHPPSFLFALFYHVVHRHHHPTAHSIIQPTTSIILEPLYQTPNPTYSGIHSGRRWQAPHALLLSGFRRRQPVNRPAHAVDERRARLHLAERWLRRIRTARTCDTPPPPSPSPVATLFSVNKKLPCRSPVGARSSLSKVSIATTASY